MATPAKIPPPPPGYTLVPPPPAGYTLETPQTSAAPAQPPPSPADTAFNRARQSITAATPNPILQDQTGGFQRGALAATVKAGELSGGVAKATLEGIPGQAVEAAQQTAEDVRKYGWKGPPPDVAFDRLAGGMGINRGSLAEAIQNRDWSTAAAEAGVPLAAALLGGRLGRKAMPKGAAPIPGETPLPAPEIAPGAGAGAGVEVPRGSIAAGMKPPATAATPAEVPRGSVVQRMAQKVVGATPERMADVPQGEEFSRGEVADAAQQHGVNLDLADVTQRPVLKGTKAVVERTLGGGGTFERNAMQNVQALDRWGHDLLESADPKNLRREQVGMTVQRKLQEHQQGLNDEAGKIFKELTDRNGAVQPDTSQTIQKKAQEIVQDNDAYYEKHPELLKGATKSAWNVVKSLAPEKAPADTWADLHRLRSDLMNEYRSPEIVGSRAEGWLKQLVEQVDNAMTSEASHLPSGDRAKFRIANDIYSGMKQTYDNPQHPFYHAIRALDGTTAGNSVSNLKPAYVRQLREAMGKDFGLVQRDQMSRLLDPNGDGMFDLKNLPARMNKQQLETLQTVLSPKQLRDLKLLSKTSQVVHASANPSRTSDVMVKAGDIANVVHNPVIGVPTLAGEFGVAKGMTSPRAVNYLTGRGSVAKQMRGR